MNRAKIAGNALRGFASHSANQAPLIILICPGGGLGDHTRAPGRSTAAIHPTHPHFPPSVGLLFVSSPQLAVRVVSPLLAKPCDKAHCLSIMPIAAPPVLRHRIDAIPNATGADGLPGRSKSCKRTKIAKNPLRGFASHSANDAFPSTNQARPDRSQLSRWWS